MKKPASDKPGRSKKQSLPKGCKIERITANAFAVSFPNNDPPVVGAPTELQPFSYDDEITPDGQPRVVIDREHNMASCYGLDHYQAYERSLAPRVGGGERE